MPSSSWLSVVISLLLLLEVVDAFTSHSRPWRTADYQHQHIPSRLHSEDNQKRRHAEYLRKYAEHGGKPPRPIEISSTMMTSRRNILIQSTAASLTTAATTTLGIPQSASALPSIASFSGRVSTNSNGGIYIPAKRCTAYLVDSTIPPSLIPYRASREAAILKRLGMGKGTPKAPLVEDDINLNNYMNRAVFGTVDAVKGAVESVAGTGDASGTRSGPNYQSFVFLGANFDDTDTAYPDKMAGVTNADAALAVDILSEICKPRERNGNTAIGLAFAPRSAQDTLDYYLLTKSATSLDEYDLERKVVETLTALGAKEELVERHLPILKFAKKRGYSLLALAPEPSDLAVVKKGGLQSLDTARREAYVADAQGFIALTQEPRFKLYTDKSLLKDYTASTSAQRDDASMKAEQGNFFAERILVHEACATAISRWATSRPNSLVVTISPISDVRFLGGINGRVPRICQYLNPDSLVDDEAVTTILLNPNAQETLSESKWLRLEIGTAPNNWTYQSKIADYLWFSSMPKVNMIPRMMNEQ